MEHALNGRQERGGGPAAGYHPSHCRGRVSILLIPAVTPIGQSRQTIIPSLKLAGTFCGFSRLCHL